MSNIRELTKLGQSIWFDYIRKSFIANGDLQNLINDGIRGVTSNPTIFEKAIAGSADYDSTLKILVEENKSNNEIYETLVLEDISQAADLFRAVYEQTDASDGYVSLEVNPTLAHDTAGTIQQAKRLFQKLNRPNVMIKVPATDEGVPAVANLIGEGINVNVTLMFNLNHYRKVVEAYLTGLEKLLTKCKDLSKVSSVASFFISRVDVAVDGELEKIGNKDLQGKIAIANAKLVYSEFLKLFSGVRWEKLRDAGAQLQRVLWASTGTKNPLYPDTLYVDELIGENTVNTLPPATLSALQDHGKVIVTLDQGLAEAKNNLSQLKSLGIDISSITEKLQQQGLVSFNDSFDKLINAISEKRKVIVSEKKNFVLHVDKYQPNVNAALKQLKEERIVHRTWEHDYTVWKAEPTEIVNRLGWLHAPKVMEGQVEKINSFVDQVRSQGFTQALLLGMGGSSLAPEVFRKIFGIKDGYLELAVLDSTNPEAVLAYAEKLNVEKTLFIASTKSGGTVETLSFLKYFYNLTLKKVAPEQVGSHFVAITDPGSGLESLAQDLNFRKIFLNDPNIGGRYSALSFFGLVPAALIGVNLPSLLENAQTIVCNCEGFNCPVNGDNSGAILGAVLGELSRNGRDKLTFIISDKIAAFGGWIEQLIAESSGKEGVGMLPVVDEALLETENYSDDRLFVYLKFSDDDKYNRKVAALVESGFPVVQINLQNEYNLGGEFFRWEIAMAIAGYFLQINPFDQPNVEAAKILARKMVAEYKEKGTLPELKPSMQTDDFAIFTNRPVNGLDEALEEFFSNIKSGDVNGKGRSYVTIQAFLQPSAEMDEALQKLRTIIQSKFRLATTLGYGPRFLHSTGQLHKGDAGNGLFIQITAGHSKDANIPDKAGDDTSSMTFGVLVLAQALGDRQALLNENRSVIRLHLIQNQISSINKITESI